MKRSLIHALFILTLLCGAPSFLQGNEVLLKHNIWCKNLSHHISAGLFSASMLGFVFYEAVADHQRSLQKSSTTAFLEWLAKVAPNSPRVARYRNNDDAKFNLKLTAVIISSLVGTLILDHYLCNFLINRHPDWALFNAIQANNVPAARAAIKKGANVNLMYYDCDKMGIWYIHKDKSDTPLHLAIRLNHLEMIQLLLEQKDIDLSLATKKDGTPLQFVVNRYIGTLDPFLAGNRINADKTLYISEETYAIVRLFIKLTLTRPDLESDIKRALSSRSLLHSVACRCDEELVKLFIQRGCDPEEQIRYQSFNGSFQDMNAYEFMASRRLPFSEEGRKKALEKIENCKAVMREARKDFVRPQVYEDLKEISLATVNLGMRKPIIDTVLDYYVE